MQRMDGEWRAHMCILQRLQDSIKKRIIFSRVFFICIVLFFPFNLNFLSAAELDLTQLSIEALMNIKVTSVGKKSQNLSNSAAAIFVITNEDLKRSGVTNIPDALRMVPGVNVARIDSNKWAVSCRGFNSRFGSKLLVLIDGRSIYTQSFSGVYWENNDVMLEDVDRIEVIRGPGATLWGANAVNGVINIITKNSRDTHGGILFASGGNLEKTITGFRYGGSLGKDADWRVYAKYNARNELESVNSGDAGDDWKTVQSGFRMDSRPTAGDSVRFQGDVYHDRINQALYLVKDSSPFMGISSLDTIVTGGNLLTCWRHALAPTSDFSFQMYYDTTRRSKDIYDEKRDNIDMDFQYHFAAGDNHDIISGLRYRYTHGDFSNSSLVKMDPVKKHDDLYSAFIQDDISFLEKRIHFILGSKFEHNDYSGFETQPSVRLMWNINFKNKLWGAVSRAVRTPSIAEKDVKIPYAAYTSPIPGIPLIVNFIGNKSYGSEKLTAYELGYRFIPTKSLSVDVTLFYNDYDSLRTVKIMAPDFTGTSFIQNLMLENDLSGNTYGCEIAASCRMSKFFKCDIAYSFLNTNLNHSGSGGFPRHQASVRGQFNLSGTVELNTWFRYVDEYSTSYIFSRSGEYKLDNYITMDLQLGWEITPKIELSLAGRNLFSGSRVEFVPEAFSLPVEVEPSFYGKLTYKF